MAAATAPVCERNFPAAIASQLAVKALAPATASVRMFVRARAWCSKLRTLMPTCAGNSLCYEKTYPRFDRFMGAFLHNWRDFFLAGNQP